MGTEIKQLTLFGDEVKIQAKKTKAEKFEDYDSFVQKFNRPELPKTTDECYTPQPVYDAVLSWLREKVDIEGRPIVRPFYPGGDYKNYEYPENCVVVDNPPFSILAEIIRFYLATDIDYFLFAPGLTLFSNSPCGDCSIVTGTSVKYANGAEVATGFHTSLFPGIKVYIASTLRNLLRRVQKKAKAAPRIVYPKNVITSALLTKYAKSGKDRVVYENEAQVYKELDLFNKLFGGGYLISDAAAKRIEEIEEIEEIELSAREKRIIERLNAQSNKDDNRSQGGGEESSACGYVSRSI